MLASGNSEAVSFALFQRCVGLDALNAMYATSYDIDHVHGTAYHERFKKYLIMVQGNDQGKCPAKGTCFLPRIGFACTGG